MAKLQIHINARQRSIIYTILTTNRHMTIKLLAKKTGLTSRIIRYNLDSVSAWLQNEDVTLNLRPGFGIDLDISRQKRKQLLELISQTDEGDLILTREQRQHLTLFELLTSSEPVTYRNLAVNEGVSRSTIVNDVNDMQAWLDSYGLVMERTQNKGAFIVGKEVSRRFALLNLIREELGERKWYSLWFDPDLQLIFDKSIPLKIETYLKNLPLGYSRTAIDYIENLVGSKIALYSRIEILVYIAIAVQAMLAKKFCSSNKYQLENCLELQVSQFILSEIGRRYELEVPETESPVLAVCLLGAKWEEDELKGQSSENEAEPDHLWEESLNYAKGLISICANQLHPLLQIDEELTLSLAKHLKPVIQRIRYDLPILNSSLEQIRGQYPEVYRSASSGLEVLKQDLGKPIPPEEIGYVTMYLAAALNRLRTLDRTKYPVVILGDGIRAKTVFLKARLEYEFPILEVVGTISGHVQENDLFKQADLVLSLLPTEVPGVSTMMVSPFLDAGERRQIQSWIAEREDRRRKEFVVPEKQIDLVDLLRPQTIMLEHTVSEWREMVTVASQPLIAAGKIASKYCDAMIKIIEDYGPYMMLAPGVIVLHARPTDGVHSLCVSMLVLEEGVAFNDQTGLVDIAFVLGAVDDHSHLNALFQLNDLLSEEAFLKSIRTSRNPADILRAIWKFSTFKGSVQDQPVREITALE